MRNFFWCYHRWFITSLALEKCKKECNILWIILVQDFCPLKIKVIQFPDGVCLNNSLKTIVQQQNSVFYWKWSAVINLSWSFISLQKCGYRIVNSYCCIQFPAVELDQKSKSMLLQLNSLWSGKKHWRRKFNSRCPYRWQNINNSSSSAVTVFLSELWTWCTLK